MRFDILTIFPDIFDSYLNESLFKRAIKNKLLRIQVHDIRAYTKNKHNKVDDKPFGGGPGMVLMVQPIWNAIRKITGAKKEKRRIILFSTRGNKLDSSAAKRLSKYDRLIFICGRYEGVDERVGEHIADEEISIGDLVLSGGELPALVTMEAISRYLPGFLGKYESLEDVKGSYPVYTQPRFFSPGKGKKEWKVPDVLLSGDHAKISAWRGQSSD